MAHVHQQQQQPWTLTLRAKAKNLDFKFKLYKMFPPVSKLFRFSVRFRLHPYIFKIKSKPESTFSLKPKFLRIFKIFQFRKRSNNKSGIARSWSCAHKNYLYGRSKMKTNVWLRVLLYAIVGWFVIMQLKNIFGQGLIWKYVWRTTRALNHVVPNGMLYQFSKVIFNWILWIFGLLVHPAVMYDI